MASTTIGDALHKLFNDQNWNNRIYNKRLQEEWEQIVGKTIAKYTDSVLLREGTLFVSTSVAILKHELQMMRGQLIQNVNEYFDKVVVKEVVIR